MAKGRRVFGMRRCESLIATAPDSGLPTMRLSKPPVGITLFADLSYDDPPLRMDGDCPNKA